MNLISPNQIAQYRKQFPHESATIEATIHYLETHNSRHCANEQTLATAWIFNPNNGKIALIHNKNSAQWQLISQIYLAQMQKSQTIQQVAHQQAQSVLKDQIVKSYSEALFDLSICLTQEDDNPQYQYRFSFVFFTENSPTKVNKLPIEWVSISQLANMTNHKPIATLAKKWQLLCFEKAQLEEKV